MRRAVVIAGLTLLSMSVFPQRLEAADLWAWIRALSGPGPFRGTQIDIRLACLGAVKKEDDTLQWLPDASQNATTLALGLYESARAFHTPIKLTDWKDKASALNDNLKRTTKITSSDAIQWAADAESVSNQIQSTDFLDCKQCASDAKRAAALYRDIASSLYSIARMRDVRVGNYGISTGVTFSACTGERSTAPLTLGVSYRSLSYTDPTGEYAGGNEMGLTTFGVAAMWRPINGIEHPKFDVVDVGVAVSRYWFTNRGSKPGSFPHFSGLMLEPIRVEIHAPSAIRNHSSLWWASIPFIQLTGVVFPAGFPPNAFGPNLVGPKAERLPAEWTWGGNVFFDLTPVVERLARRSRR